MTGVVKECLRNSCLTVTVSSFCCSESCVGPPRSRRSSSARKSTRASTVQVKSAWVQTVSSLLLPSLPPHTRLDEVLHIRLELLPPQSLEFRAKLGRVSSHARDRVAVPHRPS